uniref:IS110 family transposase n=1 Tax=unclassified Paenibacillus TaxID=185978 RepID=UPI00403F6EE7
MGYHVLVPRQFPSRSGLSQLLDVVSTVQDTADKAPVVILESTGHYHQAVIQFLEEHGILFLVVNPLISHQAKKSSLQKVKQIQSMPIGSASCTTKLEFEDHMQRGVQLLILRHLTRQFDLLTQMYVQVKLQFQAVLDLVFPDYRGIFGDLYSKVSLLR